jgi:hypothetical protein
VHEIYTSKIGTNISNAVELSGRSSAHVNVYDALNAIEECTFPAAEQLAASAPSSANKVQDNKGISMELPQNINGGGWEGLATFLFGPDWYLIPLEGEDPRDVASRLGGGGAKKVKPEVAKKPPGGKSMSTLMSSSSAANAGVVAASASTGKQLPKLATANTPSANNPGNEKNVSFAFEQMGSIGSGKDNEESRKASSVPGSRRWHAPYLDNVEPFPIVSASRKDRVSNPHRLGSISKSLHDLAAEREACRDTTVSPSLKRKLSEGMNDSSSKNKKMAVVKKDGGQEAARLAEEVAMREALRMPDDVCVRKDEFFWGCIRDETSAAAKESTAETKTSNAAADSGEKKIGAVPSASETKSSGNASTKVKFDSKSTVTSPKTEDETNPTGHITSSSDADRKPSYVPNFLPPFPPNRENMERDRHLSVSASSVLGKLFSGVATGDKKKPITRIRNKSAPGDKAERDEVRQSVIELGKSTAYWGSGWLENNGAAKDTDKSSNFSIGVVTGALPGADGAVASEKDASDAVGKKANTDSQVNPLPRASGSRFSKILEGSMN